MVDEYICELVHHGNGLWDYEPTGQELVRCKDCRYYMPKTHGCTMAGMMTPGESDFCSRGNRKDNSVKNYTVTCDDSCPVTLTDGTVSL